MKNCLLISIKYKIRNKGSKIKFVEPLILECIIECIKSYKNIKSFIRYVNYLKNETGNHLTVFKPHFYIEHNGYEIHFEKNKLERYKL